MGLDRGDRIGLGIVAGVLAAAGLLAAVPGADHATQGSTTVQAGGPGDPDDPVGWCWITPACWE